MWLNPRFLQPFGNGVAIKAVEKQGNKTIRQATLCTRITHPIQQPYKCKERENDRNREKEINLVS